MDAMPQTPDPTPSAYAGAVTSSACTSSVVRFIAWVRRACLSSALSLGDLRPRELRTGDDPADPGHIDVLAVQVASQYGHEVATIIDFRVTCQVLYVAFDGSHMWFDATKARP
jgi:hypothetical protein